MYAGVHWYMGSVQCVSPGDMHPTSTQMCSVQVHASQRHAAACTVLSRTGLPFTCTLMHMHASWRHALHCRAN